MGMAANPSKSVVLLLLLSLLTLTAPPPVSAKLITSPPITFSNFTTSNDSGLLQRDPEATISDAAGALQLTLDTVNPNQQVLSLRNVSGRVLYKTRFKLWEGENVTDRVASFNASFLVNLSPINNTTPGEGLAFLLRPDLNLPVKSYGEYLGLTNSTTDGQSSNQIIAVELDTFKEDFDPDSNHVGLNIYSVRSNKTASLNGSGMELAGPNFTNIWIEYDGVKKVINR